MTDNFDEATVEDFGREWQKFDQSKFDEAEARQIFDAYFAVFPWNLVTDESEGFDLGCGSGRWARFVAPRVGRLHCVDASSAALEVAKRNLARLDNCEFYLAYVGQMPLPVGSMDFGYSLGVLHHVPDTLAGIRSAAALLKPGAPFLLYLYYALDNRSPLFKALWRLSNVARRIIGRLPFKIKVTITTLIAIFVYFPLARAGLLFEKLQVRVDGFPLSFYRHRSFYVMKTDALDRFGTRLESRYTRIEIEQMMLKAGFTNLEFSERPPYWCVVGIKA